MYARSATSRTIFWSQNQVFTSRDTCVYVSLKHAINILCIKCRMTCTIFKSHEQFRFCKGFISAAFNRSGTRPSRCWCPRWRRGEDVRRSCSQPTERFPGSLWWFLQEEKSQWAMNLPIAPRWVQSRTRPDNSGMTRRCSGISCCQPQIPAPPTLECSRLFGTEVPTGWGSPVSWSRVALSLHWSMPSHPGRLG